MIKQLKNMYKTHSYFTKYDTQMAAKVGFQHYL